MATTLDQRAKNKKSTEPAALFDGKNKIAMNVIAWNQQGMRAGALDDSRRQARL
jgi:hypothetical protein